MPVRRLTSLLAALLVVLGLGALPTAALSRGAAPATHRAAADDTSDDPTADETDDDDGRRPRGGRQLRPGRPGRERPRSRRLPSATTSSPTRTPPTTRALDDSDRRDLRREAGHRGRRRGRRHVAGLLAADQERQALREGPHLRSRHDRRRPAPRRHGRRPSPPRPARSAQAACGSARAGTATVRIKLTSRGRRLLRRSTAVQHLTLRTRIAIRGGQTFTDVKPLAVAPGKQRKPHPGKHR